MKKITLLPLASCVLLSGCLGDLIEWSCLFSEDEEHCYQAAAVQNAEPDDCEKVVTERFEHSNPPRDKCYLQIAENTGDPTVCDEIVGGPASYTREGCLNAVLSEHHPNECENADDETACRTAYAMNGKGCGDTFAYDERYDQCVSIYESTEEGIEDKEDSPDAETMTSHISNAEQAEIDSFADAAKGRYMELLQQDIDRSTGGRKAGLVAYQEFLQNSGEQLGEVQTAYDDLMEMQRIFLGSYDPENDISNFDVERELGPSFTQQIQDRLFGPSEPPKGIEGENARAEDALTIYAAMLEQQADNDFMQQDVAGRVGSIVTSRVKNELTDTVTENATTVAKNLAGTAFGAVTHVGEALEAFKDEAQHQMFLGLARAYNRRRSDNERKYSNRSPEEIHELTVQEVKNDPYRDNTNTGFIKHGNILANPDCRDSSNPLCVDDRVWWTAMDKTYAYNGRR